MMFAFLQVLSFLAHNYYDLSAAHLIGALKYLAVFLFHKSYMFTSNFHSWGSYILYISYVFKVMHFRVMHLELCVLLSIVF